MIITEICRQYLSLHKKIWWWSSCYLQQNKIETSPGLSIKCTVSVHVVSHRTSPGHCWDAQKCVATIQYNTQTCIRLTNKARNLYSSVYQHLAVLIWNCGLSDFREVESVWLPLSCTISILKLLQTGLPTFSKNWCLAGCGDTTTVHTKTVGDSIIQYR